VRSRGL